MREFCHEHASCPSTSNARVIAILRGQLGHGGPFKLDSTFLGIRFGGVITGLHLKENNLFLLKQEEGPIRVNHQEMPSQIVACWRLVVRCVMTWGARSFTASSWRIWPIWASS